MRTYVFVSHSPYLHGAELCLLESIQSIKLVENCRIIVIIPFGFSQELEKQLRNLKAEVITGYSNVRWVDEKISINTFFLNTIKNARKFYLLLKKVQPDKVIINSIVTNPGFALGARFTNVNLVWYIHELGDLDHGYKYLFGKRLTFWMIKKLSNKIIFNSNFTRRHFTKTEIGLTIKYAVSNAVDFKLTDNNISFPKNNAYWSILICGRTWSSKGQLDVIEALNLLINKHEKKNILLTILGTVECDYLELLKIKVEKYKISNHVIFVPFSSNISKYFEIADIGITASRNEAFGRITVEYLKTGLITIGGKAGGTEEILNDFSNSYKYNIGDYENLASVLLSIMQLHTLEIRPKIIEQQLFANKIYSLLAHYTQLKEALQ